LKEVLQIVSVVKKVTYKLLSTWFHCTRTSSDHTKLSVSKWVKRITFWCGGRNWWSLSPWVKSCRCQKLILAQKLIRQTNERKSFMAIKDKDAIRISIFAGSGFFSKF